jgi:thiamine-phosphate pyrophosphorylase
MRIPRLLAISPGSGRDGAGLLEWAEAIAELGVDAIQIREKHLSGKAFFELVLALRRRLPSSLSLIVNGRPDVALAAGAEGVHLPVSAGATESWRRAFPGLLLGRSTHSREEVAEAAGGGADYALFGPVRRPRSKTVTGKIPGIPGLREAASLGLPLLALGGVRATDWATMRDAGACGLAAISLFQDLEETRALAERSAR